MSRIGLNVDQLLRAGRAWMALATSGMPELWGSESHSEAWATLGLPYMDAPGNIHTPPGWNRLNG